MSYRTILVHLPRPARRPLQHAVEGGRATDQNYPCTLRLEACNSAGTWKRITYAQYSRIPSRRSGSRQNFGWSPRNMADQSASLLRARRRLIWLWGARPTPT